MLKDKKTTEIVALKRLRMEKEGFPITSLREIHTMLKGQLENIVTVRGCHSVEDFNCLNPVHECIGWCIMLKNKKTAKIVALKRLKMGKEGFPITSSREINTMLKGQHENIVTVRGCHSVEDFNCLNPVHECIGWCIMLKDKTAEIVALKRLKMEKEGFPITSLREINTMLKGQHENIVTVRGCHNVQDFNCLNPVHERIEWCIMLKDKKTAEIVALKRLKMEKEEGFAITSSREINTVLKGQHEDIVTVRGCRSVEDFNCLKPVHKHIEWCILLKNKTEEIVVLKRLKMEKEGFPFTSLREIYTVLKGQHENIVTVKGCRSVDDFNRLNPVHEHIKWCLMLNDKREKIVALKRLKIKKKGFPITSLRGINRLLKIQHENVVTLKGCHSVHERIEWCIMLKDKTEEIVALK